ncbi:MAG TPA: transcriptional regulator [Pyrinomonadaceae bacterium]
MAKQNALKQEAGRKGRTGAENKLRKVSEEGRAAGDGAPHHQKFERLIHERSRLGIISALAVNDSLSFNDLKNLLKTTDGNLSVHARKLEDAGYIACSKFFDGRTPKTEYRLTTEGRRALEQYLNHMEALIQTMRDRS